VEAGEAARLESRLGDAAAASSRFSLAFFSSNFVRAVSESEDLEHEANIAKLRSKIKPAVFISAFNALLDIDP
jgi:hypothetical protein